MASKISSTITIRLPNVLIARLKEQASTERVSVSELVRRMIAEGMADRLKGGNGNG